MNWDFIRGIAVGEITIIFFMPVLDALFPTAKDPSIGIAQTVGTYVSPLGLLVGAIIATIWLCYGPMKRVGPSTK